MEAQETFTYMVFWNQLSMTKHIDVDEKQPFLSHLKELRDRILVCVIAVGIAFVFTYYFNPIPNDRNLEWDTKRNLFSGLTDMETPREP